MGIDSGSETYERKDVEEFSRLIGFFYSLPVCLLVLTGRHAPAELPNRYLTQIARVESRRQCWHCKGHCLPRHLAQNLPSSE